MKNSKEQFINNSVPPENIQESPNQGKLNSDRLASENYNYSSKNTETEDEAIRINKIMKQTEGNQVFIGCVNGSLYEYSMNEKRIVHYFGNFEEDAIMSMATTFDNKYLFVCDYNSFIEFDI